jgi:malonate transporter and related proteins
VAVILPALVPIYFVLLLGFTAGRMRIVDNAHIGELNTVVMSYALPASLMAATAATSREAMLRQWHLLVIFGGAMMLVYPMWYLLERRARRQSVRETAAQSLTVALPNVAGAGLPIVTALLGAGHIVPVAVAIAAGSLLPLPITMALFELSQAGSGTRVGSPVAQFARGMGHALFKPVVLAPAVGIIISLAGWHLPSIVTLSLRQIGQVAGGLALFATGLILSAQRFRLNWNVMLATVVVTIIQPLIALAIALTLRASPANLKISVLMAALPSGFFGILLGANFGIASEDSGAIVIATTVVSAGTLAVIIGRLYG